MMTYVSLIGRKDIHVSLIRRSYRMRGIVVRVAINMDITVRDCVIMSEVDRMGIMIFAIVEWWILGIRK